MNGQGQSILREERCFFSVHPMHLWLVSGAHITPPIMIECEWNNCRYIHVSIKFKLLHARVYISRYNTDGR